LCVILSENSTINSALELAYQDGWENVSIRKIAQREGFSTMKIYSDFGSKENLFFEVQKLGFKLLKEVYFNAVRNIDSPKLKLENIFLVHIQFSQQHSAHYELIFNHKFRKYELETIENKQKACGLIADIISEFVSVDAEVTYIHFFSLLEGFVKVLPELPNQSVEYKKSLVKIIAQNFLSTLE